ncbi:MAG: hypothetical protein HY785_10390 [Oscillatoriophycideae cyanobacterium NC_groundwater_1537_Pr4_S-0.65um_50_18]|nr:hypothetical protein [Oscillatoriophycideae cyanobacterium NC_groundwater_1537_Pr4_S-0.65um_50_18]
MDMVRKITNELSIAGQPALNELQPLVEEGYRSVVNLRSPDEMGFLSAEQQQAEYLGLCYANIPIQIKSLNLNDFLPAVQQLTGLPKPMLVHCDSGIRSSIVVWIQIAIEQGIRAEDAFQTIVEMGLLSY